MRAALLIALVSNACVLASDHVSTELHAICTDDVPLPFEAVASNRAAARVEVENVGATIDEPDAHATLDSVVLAVGTGIDDFGFADSMQMDLLSPGRPDARVAELEPVPAQRTLTADGDRSVDLVDYLTAERLEIRIALAGAVPQSGFLATMTACIDVEGIVVEDDE